MLALHGLRVEVLAQGPYSGSVADRAWRTYTNTFEYPPSAPILSESEAIAEAEAILEDIIENLAFYWGSLSWGAFAGTYQLLGSDQIMADWSTYHWVGEFTHQNATATAVQIGGKWCPKVTITIHLNQNDEGSPP